MLRIRLRILAKQRGCVCDMSTPSLIFPTKIGFWSGYMIPLHAYIQLSGKKPCGEWLFFGVL